MNLTSSELRTGNQIRRNSLDLRLLEAAELIHVAESDPPPAVGRDYPARGSGVAVGDDGVDLQFRPRLRRGNGMAKEIFHPLQPAAADKIADQVVRNVFPKNFPISLRQRRQIFPDQHFLRRIPAVFGTDDFDSYVRHVRHSSLMPRSRGALLFLAEQFPKHLVFMVQKLSHDDVVIRFLEPLHLDAVFRKMIDDRIRVSHDDRRVRCDDELRTFLHQVVDARQHRHLP